MQAHIIEITLMILTMAMLTGCSGTNWNQAYSGMSNHGVFEMLDD